MSLVSFTGSTSASSAASTSSTTGNLANDQGSRVDQAGREMLARSASTSQAIMSNSDSHLVSAFDDLPLVTVNTEFVQRIEEVITDLFQSVASRCQTEQVDQKFDEAKSYANVLKNRYADVLPPDTTLSSRECKPPFYINASDVNLGNARGRTYIVTQGPIKNQSPLTDTLEDFFRLMIAKGTRTIINTAKAKELKSGRTIEKCHDYWTSGKFCKYSNGVVGYRIAMLPYGNVIRIPEMEAIYVDGDRIGEKIRIGAKYTFKVVDTQGNQVKLPTTENQPSDMTISDIALFHYEEWPDYGVPKDPSHLTEFLKLAHAHERKCRQEESAIGPLTTHCSAGIGRSGVTLAVYVYIQTIVDTLTTDNRAKEITVSSPAKMILEMRRCRPDMVQTVDQFLLIYKTLEILRNDVLNGDKKNFGISKARLETIIRDKPESCDESSSSYDSASYESDSDNEFDASAE